MDPAEITIREALDIFHDLARGSRERQALALEILDVLDHSTLSSIHWAKVPGSQWLATDRRQGGRR